jgi:hypothetical protein
VIFRSPKSKKNKLYNRREKKSKIQTMDNIILHRKLKTEQHKHN